MVRKIFIYKNYFNEFFSELNNSQKTKILWVLDLIRNSDIVPSKFLKHMEGTDGLYEIRVEIQSNAFRIFCFFDQGNLIVLGNGFQKKSKKTPKTEIEKAIKIKNDYFKNSK